MLMLILKSAACLALLMLFYKIVLEQSSAHKLKRGYLLVALIASIVIPFITFYNYIEPVMDFGTYDMNSMQTPPYFPAEIITETPITETDYLPTILWSLYGLGVLIFGVKFILNLTSISSLISKNEKLKTEHYTSVLLTKKTIPHTFFNYIFFNKTDYTTNKIPTEVLLHEATHAKQKHSLDILFIELLQVAFWFNPLLYFIKKDIRLNHEFLADHAVLNQGIPTKNYQYTLLDYSTSKPHNSLANAINYPTLKKRFKIMKTHNSKRSIILRTFLIAPLLALLVFSFSQTETVERIIDNEKTVEVSPFKIYIKKENGKIYFKCNSGCDWETLTFSNESNLTYFNESGIKSNIKKPDNIDIDNSKYLFSLKYTENMFYFEGLKGTAWTKLSTNYKDGNTYSFNELGMGDLIEVPIEPKIEILSIKQNPLKLTLNDKKTSLETLKSDFEKLGLVNSEILQIEAKGALSMKLVNEIRDKLKNYIKTVQLSELAYLEDNKTETKKVDNSKPKLTVNGIICKDKCTFNFTKRQVIGLILGTSNNQNITEFKIKVPYRPTITIKGNKINTKAIRFVEKASLGKTITLFRIKSGDTEYSPVIITLVSEDSKKISNSPVVVKGEKSSIPAPKVKKGQKVSIPMPKKTAQQKISGFEKYLNDDDFKNAKIYYEGKIITKEEAIKTFKKDGSIEMITGKDKKGNYKIELAKSVKVVKGEPSNIPQPEK